MKKKFLALALTAVMALTLAALMTAGSAVPAFADAAAGRQRRGLYQLSR